MTSTLEKIRVLGENSRYDICASTASSRTEKYPNLFGDPKKSIGNTVRAGICHSYTPNGNFLDNNADFSPQMDIYIFSILLENF